MYIVMASAINAKSQNNDPSIAAHLSAPAAGSTRFLEVLDKDRFSIDPDGRNSILGNGENDFEYAFTGKHHDYCGKYWNFWKKLISLRELIRQYGNKYIATFTEIVSDV